MRPIDIEAWALRVLDSLEHGGPVEDSRVELKAAWGEDYPKTARQVAGHANAAGGDSLLWIIGVDEKTRRVVGANKRELSNWQSQVEACFDGIAPAMTDCIVPWDGTKAVVALHIETDRAPYVVKNPAWGVKRGERVEWEVPWRETTATRTARREDLVRILAPLARLPAVELLAASLVVDGTWEPGESISYLPHELGMRWPWTLELRLYFVPKMEEPLVFPTHRVVVEVEQAEAFGKQSFCYSGIEVEGGSSQELIIVAPSQHILKAHFEQVQHAEPGAEATALVRLAPAGIDRVVTLTIPLSRDPGDFVRYRASPPTHYQP